jgi:aspartyl protease family protein
MTALNAQLIVANRNRDAATNNAIVGELNLRNDQRKELSKAESEARAKANAALEEYVTFVVEARRLADKITHDYKLLAEDKDVGSAIDELNKATGKTFALTESKAFQASLKMLKRIEDQVLSDEIPLKAQSNTFHVATTLNGKYPKDMLVDSGASLILIPDKVAKEIDLFVPEDAKPLKLKLADGRIIDGKLIQLASVRVGRFEIENVDAAVLGPDFPSAEPLLGMSFLQNFNFKIDADAAKLTMTKIDDSSKGAKAAPAKGTPAKTGKK